MTWNWFELSEDGGASGIAPSQVFHGRSVEHVVARETIQNSWDASRRYLEEDRRHQCLVKFEYRTLGGDAKQRLIDTLDLAALRERVESDPGLLEEVGGGAWREAVEGDTGLPVLYVSDYGPHGLYGHPRLRLKSPLWLAMRTTGITDKKGPGDTAGGSFGLGKGAMLYASHAGLLVAYSRFDPFEGDPATRRLEGAARWPDHPYAEDVWTGQARFGGGATASPFEDDEADEIADALGMPSRLDPAELPFEGANPRGTTFMIVDPRLDPTLLKPAIEEFWWPALAQGEFADNLLIEVEVAGDVDGIGGGDEPWRPELGHYFRALDVAQRRGDAPAQNELHEVLNDPELGVLGNLGLVMLPSDADEEPDPDGEETSLPEGVAFQNGAVVALTRKPRMVVQYYTRNSRRNVRGVFVADPAMNEVLRDTEPPTHDDWGSGTSGTNAGAALKKAINKAIRDFARDARPPRAPGEARIPALDRWLNVFSGAGHGETRSGSRPFQIQGQEGEAIAVTTLRRATDPPDTIRAEARFRVRLNPAAQLPTRELEAYVSVLGYQLDETDRPIKELDPVRGTFAEKPFIFDEARPSIVRGRVKDDWLEFRWVSEPYERDTRIGCSVEVEFER